MSRILISSLVGAIILFVFQAASWMALGIHDGSFKYAPGQDAVLTAMAENLEEGMYYLPYFDGTNMTQEEIHAAQQANAGKPWAILHYHGSMEMSMAGNMGYGFLIDFFVCLFISLVLVNINVTGFALRMFFVMALAALVALGGPLYQANWFKTPGHFLTGELIDILIGYFLAGLWMSWWTGRK